MTFNDFVKRIASENNLSKSQSRKLIKSVFSNITDIVIIQDKLLVPDFGKFSVVLRKARIGTNLVTNQKVAISPKIAVKFSPTKTLKESVNS